MLDLGGNSGSILKNNPKVQKDFSFEKRKKKGIAIASTKKKKERKKKEEDFTIFLIGKIGKTEGERNTSPIFFLHSKSKIELRMEMQGDAQEVRGSSL